MMIIYCSLPQRFLISLFTALAFGCDFKFFQRTPFRFWILNRPFFNNAPPVVPIVLHSVFEFQLKRTFMALYRHFKKFNSYQHPAHRPFVLFRSLLAYCQNNRTCKLYEQSRSKCPILLCRIHRQASNFRFLLFSSDNFFCQVQTFLTVTFSFAVIIVRFFSAYTRC